MTHPTPIYATLDDWIAHLELHACRPELVAKSDESRSLEAAQYASVAQQLLNYHAALARESSERVVRLLGMRDALMADNLVYMFEGYKVSS